MTKYLEELNMKATEKATEYCSLYNNGAKAKELKAAKKAANDAVAEYNLALSKEQYREWAKEGKPVELAIRSRVVPGAIRIQFKEKDDVMGFAVKPAEYAISLPMMHVVLGEQIFAKKDWFAAIEKLCLLTLNYLNEDCGNGSFDYQVAKAGAEFKFPKTIDPLSEEGVILALQHTIDRILFIKDKETGENLIHTTTGVDSRGKTYSKEWTVIRESMTASGGVNKVAVCNTVRFCDYIVNAMHGMLTRGDFGLVTDDEYIGLEAFEQAHKNSELKNGDQQTPEAGEVPETHKPAKAKKGSKKTK